MKQRGRKGTLKLASVTPLSVVERPEPPEDLSELEARIWREAIGGMRAAWISPVAYALLKGYCAQAAFAEAIAAEMRKLDYNDDPLRYNKLAKTHERALKTVLYAATKLRLTPSSQRQPRDGIEVRRGPKPWEGFGDEPA